MAVCRAALQRFLGMLSVSGASELVVLPSGIRVKTGHAMGVGQRVQHQKVSSFGWASFFR